MSSIGTPDDVGSMRRAFIEETQGSTNFMQGTMSEFDYKK